MFDLSSLAMEVLDPSNRREHGFYQNSLVMPTLVNAVPSYRRSPSVNLPGKTHWPVVDTNPGHSLPSQIPVGKEVVRSGLKGSPGIPFLISP